MSHDESMVPVSACILAKNEEKILPICLQSLQGWVQEIVVVVNDCTDRTKEVAESFGACVIEHTWEGYGEQRNFARTCAQAPWLLSIDADEEVTPELRASIEHFFAQSDTNQYAAGLVKRLNQHLGQWKLYDTVAFLLKKESVHWEGSVHEHACFQGNTKKLTGWLLHRTEKNVAHALQKNIHYAQIKAVFYMDKYSRACLIRKMVLHPPMNFFALYVLKGYMWKGVVGFYVSAMQSIYCFFKYLFALEQKMKKHG